MENRSSIVRTFVFFLALSLPALIWGILGITGARSALDTDTGENRNKHSLSAELTLSNLTSELEETYNDHLPFRSMLLKTHQKLDNMIEQPYANALEPLFISIANIGYSPESTEASASAPTAAPTAAPAAAAPTAVPAAPDTQAGANTPDLPAVHEHNFVSVEHVDATYENYGYDLFRCSCGEEVKQFIDKPVDESYFPYKLLGETVVLGRYDWLFLNATFIDWMYPPFFSDEELGALASSLTSLRDLCSSKGIGVKYIFFPNKCTVYPEYLPTADAGSGTGGAALDFESYMQNNTDLDLDFVYEEMLAAKPYHVLYHKLDTHWNSWGTLQAVNVLYPMLGLPVISEDSLSPEYEERATGDLAALAGSAYTGSTVDTPWSLHYKPDIEQTVHTEEQYAQRYVETWSDAENDQTVVLVGDSYNYGILEFLPCDYRHVIYVSWEIIDEVAPEAISQADILIVDGVERNLRNLPHTAERLLQIFSES